MRIALATCAQLPDLVETDRTLTAILRERGHACDAVVWNNPTLPWDTFDAVVIRSIWDYHLVPQEFHEWLGRLEEAKCRVINPTALLRWNSNKRYLARLEDFGPVVETVWFAGDKVEALQEVRARGWDELVIKPQVSAGATGTHRVGLQDLENSLDGQHSELMIQAFAPEICGNGPRDGERSLIFLGGQFSHAARKTPAAQDFRVQEEYGGTVEAWDPTPELVSQAANYLLGLPEPSVYARVDGIIRNGHLNLMELEVIEPSLYFRVAPHALPAFADCICSQLRPI